MKECLNKNEGKVSLKSYVESRIDGLEKLTDERFKTSQLALNKSEESLKEYKTQANEWRGQSKDQNQTYLQKTEYEVFQKIINEKIDNLRLNEAELKGKADQKSVALVMIIAIFSMIFSLVDLLVKFIK